MKRVKRQPANLALATVYVTVIDRELRNSHKAAGSSSIADERTVAPAATAAAAAQVDKEGTHQQLVGCEGLSEIEALEEHLGASHHHLRACRQVLKRRLFWAAILLRTVHVVAPFTLPAYLCPHWLLLGWWLLHEGGLRRATGGTYPVQQDPCVLDQLASPEGAAVE
jgi:hypothetical protein